MDADVAVRKKVNMLVPERTVMMERQAGQMLSMHVGKLLKSVLQNQLEDIVCNTFSKFKWKIVKNNIEHYYWLKGIQSVTLKFFKKGNNAYW